MTGYGSSEVDLLGQRALIEIRSVNHRFLDITVKTAKFLMPLETEIKRVVAGSLARGKVEVSIKVNASENNLLGISLNHEGLENVYEMLQQIKNRFPVAGEISLQDILMLKDDIFEYKESCADLSPYWEAIKPAIGLALDNLKEMQNIEGAEIQKDILSRLTVISALIEGIESIYPDALAARQANLVSRVKTLCSDIEIDENRLCLEVALLADKSDIAEEIVRIKVHIKQFLAFFESGDPSGRKLDFLMQELNREINTTGAKASSAEISHKVVAIKNELERVREQIQNII